jgi:Tfp pilus assembly protein PilF
MRRDLLEDARADLEFVIGFDHDNTAALSALAYAWLLEGDLNRAQKYYRRALRTDPQNLEVLNNLATVLAEKLQYRKAIEVWEKALKLDPGNQDILDNLKEARQSAGER